MAITLKQLEASLAAPEWGGNQQDVLSKFYQSDFGTEAIPLLRRCLRGNNMSMVGTAAICVAKLGPKALNCPEGQADAHAAYENLEQDLMIAGSRIWSHTGYCNCYSSCLGTLLKVESDPEYLVDYIHHHIGIAPHDLIHSLEALKKIGTPKAFDLLKRAVVFWLPELNKALTKKVQAIAGSV